MVFELEPGPLEPLDPLPAARFFRDGMFSTDAADFAGARSGAAGALDAAAIVVAGDGVPDIIGAYGYYVGPAEEAASEELDAGHEPVPDSVLERGDVTNVHAAAVAQYLPGPDADVPTNFADPPEYHPPGGPPLGGEEGVYDGNHPPDEQPGPNYGG